MPTYDYVCEACGHAFEHFQSMSDARLRTCPKCKKRKLVRLVGAGAGLIFKGTGFYQTDYKAPAAGASAKNEGEGGAPSKGDTAAGESKGSDGPKESKESKGSKGSKPASAPESATGSESRGSEPKRSESKGSDSRGSESRGSESPGSESRGSESKKRGKR